MGKIGGAMNQQGKEIWGSDSNYNNKMEEKHFFDCKNKNHLAWGLFSGSLKTEFQSPKSTKLKELTKDIEKKLQEMDSLQKIEYWITELDADEPIFYIIHTVLSIPIVINKVENFIVSHEDDIFNIVEELRPELKSKVSAIIQKFKQSQQRRITS